MVVIVALSNRGIIHEYSYLYSENHSIVIIVQYAL
jgi:hypothetical protein